MYTFVSQTCDINGEGELNNSYAIDAHKLTRRSVGNCMDIVPIRVMAVRLDNFGRIIVLYILR